MADSGDHTIRQTIFGSALAGGVAVVVLSAMATFDIGSDLVQFAVALLFGVIVAQAYESIQA